MELNLKKAPFSYPGSYYVFRYLEEEEAVCLISLHKDAWSSTVCTLHAFGADDTPEIISASEISLTIGTQEGSVEFLFETPEQIIARGKGVGLKARWNKASQIVRKGERYEISCFAQNARAVAEVRKGRIVADYCWSGDNCDEVNTTFLPQQGDESWECRIQLRRQRQEFSWEDYSWEASLRANRARYDNWIQDARGIPEKYREADELAQYLMWSSVVEPEGHFTRRTMYSSKVYMLGVWSWDHCFHAVGVMGQDPELAWDQWMLMFDQQNGQGALPDQMDDIMMFWGCLKPPVHGFFLDYMMREGGFIKEEHLRQAYGPLARWTLYWFADCDSNGDGLPEYGNGNDSGWDNNTTMLKGTPVDGPDLAAYLILSMDVLGRIAGMLGRQEEAAQWERKSQRTMELFLERFVVGGRIKARLTETGEAVDSHSLICYLPLLLGQRLPMEVRKNMIDDLKEEGGFLTSWGLASENLNSSSYTPDGYWRGPVWAPAVFLAVQGLMACGERELAADVMERFCNMVARERIMAENFNAVTGEALRDPCVTWTACIFHHFVSEYLREV